MEQKTILVAGAGGFIGTNLVTELKKQGHRVVGIDIKENEFKKSDADFFHIGDLADQGVVGWLFTNHKKFDEVYNLAAVMGGMEYLANGEHDYKVLNESTLININILNACIATGVKKIFYASSACIYPENKQMVPENPGLKEEDAYPGAPDLEYGWQKLFSERVYMAAQRNHGIQVRIGRFHNIYGPYTEYYTDKAKAPAALCRKVAEIPNKLLGEYDSGVYVKGEIEVIGDGLQTRSFTCIEDCLEGIFRLMDSDHCEPINIGSSEMIAINDLAKMIIDISGKNIQIKNIDGPQGVRGRNSENTKIQEVLGWEPPTKLRTGIERLYRWVESELQSKCQK